MANTSVVHRAAWVLPIAGPPIADGQVVVFEGHIVSVGPARGPADVDHGYQALIPAFVNAHSHLEYTLFRNLNEVRPFVPWIKNVTRMKRSASEEEFAAAALIGAVENARAGVGLIGEHSDAPVCAQAIRAAGIRGVVFQEFICINEAESPTERLAMIEEKAARQRQEGGDAVEVQVSPHAPYSVIPAMLRRFESGRRSIHCAESVAEMDFLTSGEGQLAEAFREFGLTVDYPGVRPVPYLASLGLLHEDMQLVHCVQVLPEEIIQIASSGAGIAHCPKSNRKLGVGTAPLFGFLEAGIPVGLGTDSLMSNNRVDMFEEMRTAGFLSEAPIPAPALLKMATLDGARTLGRDGECGSLGEGKRADFITIDLSGAHTTPLGDIENALVYCACAKDVTGLWMAGENAPSVDLREAAATCNSAAARISTQS